MSKNVGTSTFGKDKHSFYSDYYIQEITKERIRNQVCSYYSGVRKGSKHNQKSLN